MSSHAQNPNERRENNNVFVPPELSINLPKQKDIGKMRRDWASIEPELPIDILLVTVKDHEFVNCYYYLENKKRSWCHGLGMVDLGTFGDGAVKVALVRCEKGSIEPNASLIVVKNAVEILQPKAVICVGYCASINPEKVKLGDVVISAKLASLSPKRIVADGTQQMRGFKTHVSKNMGHLIPFAADGWEPPLNNPDSFDVKVHRQAVMLSGSEVVNNFEKRQELLRHFPDALAVEMEGEGLYAAACDLGIEWVVVKGASDFADGSMTDTQNWQPFASAMAASVVHNMFRYYDVIQNWANYQKPVQRPMSTEVTAAASHSTGPPINPIAYLLRRIAGTKEGRKMYNGRTIEYSVSERFHSLEEPSVFDATARDVASGTKVEEIHADTAELAINGAVEKLVKKLKEQKVMPD
ncbi:uncharacterized protein LOC114521855 isoform X1 [Dendronephthya gigantea]|uniref:uncharacterized protein LOC114521855 isoform X1 n=1 Tax=Dendronephthya gigantea TaxID=151771 RepID=UPI001068EE85|nr:uncharacterized protein LOC114521855 isoform X1 [Dendronephthya gigantea]